MKKLYLIAGIVLFVMLVLVVALFIKYQNQREWASTGRELFLNNLMENLKAQVKENAGYVVEHPITFDESKVRTELNTLPNQILKGIKKRSPAPNENYNNWKLLSEEDPLALRTFYVSRSVNDRRVFIIWVKELQIPLSGSIFLTTWEHHGVYRKKEFLKDLLRIGVTNEEIDKLWEEVSKRDDNGWL